MKIRCFISYRWDARQADVAKMLADRLSGYSDIEPWIDVERFQIGVHLHNWLERGIDHESDLFVPILSPEYLASDMCQKELAHAVQLAGSTGKPILPIVLSNIDIPLLLGDLTWGDFRNIFTDSDELDQAEFDKSVDQLVKSIRFHGEQLARVKQIRSSAVRTPLDLCSHLLFRIYGQATEWRPTSFFFPLYCDISDDRGFEKSPDIEFGEHLHELVTQGYVLASKNKSCVQYGKYETGCLPSEIKISPMGLAHIQEARSKSEK